MVQRVPIKVKRTPVKLPPDIKFKLELERVQYLTKEEDILDMANVYSMYMMDIMGKGGYKALSDKNYTRHRNWKHFERIWEVCRMKDWDYKLYIQSQFERAKSFTRVMAPQPHMMYSVDALRYFTNYLATIRLKYKYDTKKDEKEKGKGAMILREKVIEDVARSVDSLKYYIERTKFEDKAQYKALRIYESWQELSPFYLWCVPWFRQIVPTLGDSPQVDKLKKEFDRLEREKGVREMVEKVVQQTEEMCNMPPTISL